MTQAFGGDKQKGQSLRGPAERRFIDWAVPKIPAPVMTQHLTMITVLWSTAAGA